MLKQLLICFLVLWIPVLQAAILVDDKENYTHALGSLVYLVHQEQDETEDKIPFTKQEVISLWDRAAHYLYKSPASTKRLKAEEKFEKAYQNYFSDVSSPEAKAETYRILSSLWSAAIKAEEAAAKKGRSKAEPQVKKSGNQDFEKNRVISAFTKNVMRPYVIPDKHPAKKTMDSIFSERVTYNEKLFLDADFKIISKRPRSYVYVARHPKLKGYIVKAYMDTEKRLKMRRDSWYWLVKRCEGAAKIKKIITEKKIKYFSVADKWIYPLPDKNLPPRDKKHKRHLAALLAKDMRLIPYQENLLKWKTIVNKEYLDELYYVISRAKGSSYRPDNIWYSYNNTFAFIDTEYPSKSPDYYSIREFLNASMREYWDSLVKNGIR